MDTKPVVAAVALACFGIFGLPSTASACSTTGCLKGAIAPHQGTVPANLPAFVWHPATWVHESEIEPEAKHIELVKIEGDGETVVPLSLAPVSFGSHPAWEVVPQQALAPNASYEVRTDSFCLQDEGLTTSFNTAPESPLPDSLGTLVADEATPGVVWLDSSACSSEFTAYRVPIHVELSPEAQPWKDVLLFETLVDGEPWRPAHATSEAYPPGESWEGRGNDLLYSLCGREYPRLEEGAHTVQMKATLAGTDIELATNELTVEIDCSWIDDHSSDTGIPDAESRASSQTDANAGAACNATGGSRPINVAGFALLALAGLVFLGRRLP